MRHLKHRSQLGRTSEHRAALMANLSAALLTHGRIKTTLPKAKALRPYVERVITLARHAIGAEATVALHLRRQALSKVRDGEAVGILFNQRASEFKDRSGGYTRIYKLGNCIGDNAEMALIELVAANDEGYPKSRKSKPAKAEAPVAEEAAPEAVEAVAEAEEVPAEEVAEGEDKA